MQFLAIALTWIGSSLIVAESRTPLSHSTPPATYVVTVAGVPSNEGYVFVALYKNAADFPKAAHADYTRKVPARLGRVSVDFAELAPGSYAVAVFHDADDNGKITTTALGMPREAYGFGNDARGTFGPPSFESSLVKFDGQGRVVVNVK